MDITISVSPQGPECGRSSDWVVAHWFETDRHAAARGMSASRHNDYEYAPLDFPITVEGQTRYRVCPETLKILEFVETRTFTAVESAFLEQEYQEQLQMQPYTTRGYPFSRVRGDADVFNRGEGGLGARISRIALAPTMYY